MSDALAETDFSKDGLFPYCPDEFVSWSYREHLILDEIKGYKASIIALQELDTKLYKGKTDYNSWSWAINIYSGNFGKALADEGYESFFSNKSASPEGVCLFWNQSDFEIICKRDYPINGALLDKDDSLFHDIQKIIEGCKVGWTLDGRLSFGNVTIRY